MKKNIIIFLISICTSLYSSTISNTNLLSQTYSVNTLLDSTSRDSTFFKQIESISPTTLHKGLITTTYYQDADNDGFGNDDVFVETDAQPVGYVNIGGDCDDSNSLIYPGATEVCFDGIDQNCDGYLTEGCQSITAQLMPENCGITLLTINETLRANFLSQTLPPGVFVFRYRFRITNLLTNEIRIIDRLNYILQLTYTNFAEYNTPYSVEVQLRLNQEWTGEYGPACIVITPPVPNTQLASTSCGSTIVQMNNIIRAETVPVVTNYGYEVSLIEGGIPVETTTLITPNESFNLLQLSGISIKYASQYRVRIKIQGPTPNGLTWSSTFGEPCYVYTPNAPVSSIEGCQVEDGIALSSMSEIVFASPNGGATLYRFTLSDDYGYLHSYLTPNRYFRLSNFNEMSALTIGRDYSIQVEVEIYNYFYSGKDCNIKMIGSSPLLRKMNSEIELINEVNQATAYPNPYSSFFSLDFKSKSDSPITIMIYDMTGRLLNRYYESSSQLSKRSLGELYSNGVYNVVLIQNNQTKTIRVLKQ